MIVYKVMHRSSRKSKALTSAITFGKAEKHYRPGVNHHAPHWLTEQGYHMTAFRTLMHARSWRKSNTTEVWRCEATDIIRYKALPQRCLLYALSNGDIVAAGNLWPEGTIMCKTIKLLEEVT